MRSSVRYTVLPNGEKVMVMSGIRLFKMYTLTGRLTNHWAQPIKVRV